MTNKNCKSQLYMTEQNKIYRLIWLCQSVCDYQKQIINW